MPSHFDDLFVSTAHDGASASIGVCSIKRTDDLDLLMSAWYRERQERIEAGLFLDEARRLLRRMLSEGGVSSASRRKASRLLAAIETANHDRSDECT